MTATPNMPESPETRLKRLRFRAWHRGTKEADLILGKFADTHLSTLPPDLVDQFEHLLGEQDVDLMAWINGQLPVPAELDTEVWRMVRRLDFM